MGARGVGSSGTLASSEWSHLICFWGFLWITFQSPSALRSDTLGPMGDQRTEARLRQIVLAYPEPIRRALLHVVMAPPAERVETIAQLYGESGGSVTAELLIDLEADRSVALMVADALKDSLKEGE
jgi:hypothetical protein